MSLCTLGWKGKAVSQNASPILDPGSLRISPEQDELGFLCTMGWDGNFSMTAIEWIAHKAQNYRYFWLQGVSFLYIQPWENTFRLWGWVLCSCLAGKVDIKLRMELSVRDNLAKTPPSHSNNVHFRKRDNQIFRFHLFVLNFPPSNPKAHQILHWALLSRGKNPNTHEQILMFQTSSSKNRCKP